MRLHTRRPLLSFAAAAALLLLAPAAGATIIDVTSNSDDTTTGNCTLREAVKAATTRTKVDQCPAGTSSNVIELPSGTVEVDGNFTTLKVTGNLTINGMGYGRTTLFFARPSRGLEIGDDTTHAAANVVLQYLTYTGSDLFVDSEVVVATMNYVEITGQSVGVFVETGATLNISNSQVINVSAFSPITNDGSISVWASTFQGNHGQYAGVFENYGALSIGGSTIANNTSDGVATIFPLAGASAIYNANGAMLAVTSSTIAYNNTSNIQSICTTSNCGAITTAAAQGGLLAGETFIGTSVVAKNTVTGLTSNTDCAGVVTSWGYNLLGTSALSGCPKTATDLTPQDPKLTTSGSPTFAPVWSGGVGAVYVPQATSPLVNAIPASSSICMNPDPDQRGMGRGKGSGCEPGAVERGSAIFVVDNPAALNAGDTTTLAMMRALGFSVAVVDDDVVSAATASGIQLVAISESVTSTKIANKLRSVSSDVFLMEPSLYDDMSLTGPTENTHYGHLDNQIAVRLRNSSLFQTLGMIGSGTATLITTNSAQTFGWGTPAATATIFALTNEAVTTHAAFFSYPHGTALFDGSTVSGNRVGFYAFPGAAANLTGGGIASGRGAMMEALIYTVRP